MDHFFGDERAGNTFAVTRKKDHLRFPEMPGLDEVAFDFESLDYLATDRKFNAYLANFRELPLKKVCQNQHGGSLSMC
jgi:hypothetical protein